MRPDRPFGDSLPWGWLAALASAACLAQAFFSHAVLAPGLPAWDELYQAHHLQRALQGEAPIPLRFSQGTLYSWWRLGFLQAFGPGLGALDLANAALLALEFWLLWRWTLPLFGRRAAALAVMVDAGSAYTLMRARTQLCFSAVPVELLALLLLTRWAWAGRRAGWAAAAGALAGLALCEYDVWAAGWAVLALEAAAARRQEGRLWRAAALGWALGAALVLGLGWGFLGDYARIRGGDELSASLTAMATGGMRSLWRVLWGGPGDMILRGHPMLPGLSLAAAIAGSWIAWSRRRGLLAWAALGLAALFTASFTESNRAVLAFPALAVLSGLGLDALAGAGRHLPAAAAGLLLGLPLTTAAGLNASLQAAGAATFGPWQELDLAGRVLEGLAPEARPALLTRLHSRPLDEIKLLRPEAGAGSRGLWVLTSGDLLPSLKPGPQDLVLRFRQDSERSGYLLWRPPAGRHAELKEAAAGLEPLHRVSTQLPARRAALAGQLWENSPALLRGALAESWLLDLRNARLDPAPALRLLEAAPPPHPRILFLLADRVSSSDPARARQLVAASLALDPGRPAARELARRLR